MLLDSKLLKSPTGATLIDTINKLENLMSRLYHQNVDYEEVSEEYHELYDATIIINEKHQRAHRVRSRYFPNGL
jgi:hypothetical protein